jgi:membrane fusion protein (multidrug efflux system)
MHTPARRVALRILPVAAIALLVAACGPSQQPGGFQGFPPSEVTTFIVEPKAVPASYEYVGQTAGSNEVEVRARITGILERKLFQEGAPVKAGQVLFVIDPKPLAAQNAALEHS